jgi:hypothetical protein
MTSASSLLIGARRSQRSRSVLRSIGDLDENLIVGEACRTLANSRVVWANYDLIERDFSHVDFSVYAPSERRATRGERPDIDAWLLKHAAIISEAQLQSNNANEDVPVVGPSRVAYRPPRYGRALVVQLSDTWPDAGHKERVQGLLDIKGCGVAFGRVPQRAFHQNGLLPFPEAFRELILQAIIERIFDHLRIDVRGIGIYAILELGFRKKVEGGTFIPAGAIIRRAHQRAHGNIERPNFGSEDYRVKLLLELLLRRFGITSCNPIGRLRIWRENGQLCASVGGVSDTIRPAVLERFLRSIGADAPTEFDIANVQLSRGASLAPLSADLVDFGHYYVGESAFVAPLATLVRNRPLNWGGFIDEKTDAWVQPDPAVALDFGLMGTIPTPPGIYEWLGMTPPPYTTGLSVFVTEIARDVNANLLAGRDLDARLRGYVDSATKNLNQRAAGVTHDIGDVQALVECFLNSPGQAVAL